MLLEKNAESAHLRRRGVKYGNSQRAYLNKLISRKHNENGILIMGVYDFLLNPGSFDV